MDHNAYAQPAVARVELPLVTNEVRVFPFSVDVKGTAATALGALTSHAVGVVDGISEFRALVADELRALRVESQKSMTRQERIAFVSLAISVISLAFTLLFGLWPIGAGGSDPVTTLVNMVTTTTL